VRDDVVIITGDLPETKQIAELSLKALKHVFIAKIDNLNFGQMQNLRKIAEESGVVLLLGIGYKFCSAYNKLNETVQQSMVIEIKHQLNNNKFFISLINDIDFVTNLLDVNISKYNVKAWNNTENYPDLLHCCLECDNGSVINATIYTNVEDVPKLEINFITSETIINVDIFGSTIKKQNRTGNVIENITLETYCEKIIYDYYLQNFDRAISNDLDALRIIDKQYQNIVVANSIFERIKPIH